MPLCPRALAQSVHCFFSPLLSADCAICAGLPMPCPHLRSQNENALRGDIMRFCGCVLDLYQSLTQSEHCRKCSPYSPSGSQWDHHLLRQAVPDSSPWDAVGEPLSASPSPHHVHLHSCPCELPNSEMLSSSSWYYSMRK